MQIKRLGIFPNLNKDNVSNALPEFAKLCENFGLTPVLPKGIAAALGYRAYDLDDSASLLNLDAAVSLGGDGTLLQMAKYVVPHGLPAFGINFGKLGFLAEIEAQSISKALNKIILGDFAIESRSLLQASVIRDGITVRKVHALNELVLSKGVLGKLAHFVLYINGNPSGRYSADGIIVATATGSTAYSLSAGGPMVMPELDVSVITPICALSLTARTLVVPMSEVLELRGVVGSEDMLLVADGVNVEEIANTDIVRIEKSPFLMKFLRLTRRDYYQTWQQKLTRNL